MTQTIHRQIEMLRAVPREPLRRTVQELAARLRGEGHDVTVRTVQRDLNELSTMFPLSCDIEGRTQYWYYPKGMSGLDIPGMGAGEALVFRMAELHLASALPSSQLEHLQPYFAQARTVIESSDVPLSQWRKRVRVIQRGPHLSIPSIQPGVAEAVHLGLVTQCRVKISYIKRGDERSKEHEASIQALVLKEGVMYAVVTLWSFEDLLHFALHRILKAEATDTPATTLRNFDLDSYIHREAVFSYPSESRQSIRLVLRVTENVKNHLNERRLSPTQLLKPVEDRWWELTAEIADTQELRWWILGMGDQVEVIKPKALRNAITAALERTLQRYQ